MRSMYKLFFLFPLIMSSLFAEESNCKEPKVEQVSERKEATDTKKEEEKKCDEKKEEAADEKPIKKGNLLLRGSQQPTPLIAFGERVIDSGEVQALFYGDYFKTTKGYYIDTVPGLVYGINDSLSVFINFPFIPTYKDLCDRSSGPGDIFVQFEYAFYNKTTRCSSRQATVVTNISFPTGSSHSKPATGIGSPSFFLGTTYNYTGTYWLSFASGGVIFPTFRDNNKHSDIYLYQWGIGHNIPAPKGCILAWILEFDGLYSYRNIVNCCVDPNSGGNILYVTPSLWFSNNKFFLQIGAGGVVTQQPNGKQSKYTYQIVWNAGWTFN